MAPTVPGLKIAVVGLTQRACRPTLLQTAKYSWEPKEVETHTGQVSSHPVNGRESPPKLAFVDNNINIIVRDVVEMGKRRLSFGAFH